MPGQESSYIFLAFYPGGLRLLCRKIITAEAAEKVFEKKEETKKEEHQERFPRPSSEAIAVSVYGHKDQFRRIRIEFI